MAKQKRGIFDFNDEDAPNIAPYYRNDFNIALNADENLEEVYEEVYVDVDDVNFDEVYEEVYVDVDENADDNHENIELQADDGEEGQHISYEDLENIAYPNLLRNDRAFDDPDKTFKVMHHEFVSASSWVKLWLPEEKMLYKVYKRNTDGDIWRCGNTNCKSRDTICLDKSCIRFENSNEHSHTDDHEHIYNKLVCRAQLYKTAIDASKACGGVVVKASNIIKQAMQE